MDRIVIEIKGADGIDLLHRISTWNAHKRQQGQTEEALLLNPAGKILAAFSICPTSETSVQIQIDDLADQSHSKKFLEVLDQFTFGEQYGVATAPSVPFEPDHLSRIKNAKALVGNEFLPDGKTSPLEVNLGNAIADQKGCYPGQEIIEKMISIGSSPKRLVTLKSISKIEEGAPLMDASQQVGTVTSVVQDGTFWIALAIVRKTHGRVGQTFTHGGNALEIISQN